MPQRLRVQYSVEKLVRRMMRARGVRYLGWEERFSTDAVVFNGIRRSQRFGVEVSGLEMLRFCYNWRAMKRILTPRIEGAINAGS